MALRRHRSPPAAPLGPGAYEPIVLNVPTTPADLGEAAYVVRHQFNIRYVSQNGLPDLRVTHRIKQLLSPDLELIHNEFVGFSAVCIDGNRVHSSLPPPPPRAPARRPETGTS